MLHYDRVDISKGTDLTKSTDSKECMDSNFKILYAMVVMI